MLEGRAWQAWKVGLCKPQEVQLVQVQGHAPGLGQSHAQIKAGQLLHCEYPLEKGFEMLMDETLNKSQHYGHTGQKANHILHQEKWD